MAVAVQISDSRRRELAASLERALRELLEAWFPRCLDEMHGGFLCDFDYRWRQTGPQHKALEYQARMTRLGALLVAAHPDVPLYREIAEHGFRYLHDVMWDAEHGGWYRLLERDGTPGEGETKHAHGMAYALSACAAYHAAMSDAESLELGMRGFAWLERHAHDAEHGGYFNMFAREGRRILRGEDSPLPNRERDVIGAPYGYKDSNTGSDLLDALTCLCELTNEPLVRERLREMFLIVRDRFVAPPGSLHTYFHPDWCPVPDFARYSQAIHTANHLIEASVHLGYESDERTRAVFKSILDTTLRYGWDPKNGGFHFGGSTFGPLYVAEARIFLEQKVWWGQAEGMKLLLRASRLFPDEERNYFALFEKLWAYVQKYVIDSRHGGWYRAGSDFDPKARTRPKATEWRDASHEASSLLECIQTLRSNGG